MVHALIVTSGIVPDVFVSTELIRVYGECGELSVSRRVFDDMPVRSTVSWNAMVHQYVRHSNVGAAYELFLAMPRRDVVSWNTMIAGYCLIGRRREALELFRQMVSPSSCAVHPNGHTMSTVLAACAGAGCLETGIWVHAYIDRNRMNDDGSLDRSLIDMYAKCGSIERPFRLQEAYSMIRTMPMKPNAVIWGAFLNACKVHSNVELGEIAAAEVSRLDPSDPWARVMLSSMYAKAQDWTSLARERKEMNSLQMKKTPGCSSIELDGEVHEFVAGGFQHPQLGEICTIIENMESQTHAG
ncbi:pentatricopeptide repeat-containing protein [Panicum miliaceum]|uniref:Pentatricopeptide repeat-containing protein n=1 Tax=Panicum miliaceum TaxID=4540 RepID=A0A3L6TTU3_PANMI|nr:pentatricopeptide repeat-containing protein [Panicum miliaceum]